MDKLVDVSCCPCVIQCAGLNAIQKVMQQKQDIVVWQLVQASDFLLKKAHKFLANSTRFDHQSQLDHYNTLIKASLNCLFKVLRQFSSLLDAKVQSILYYKTAQILFKETISSDLAVDYCTKGIQISKRNEPNLTSLKLKLQYLNFQIQFQSSVSKDSKNLALNYINNIIENEIPNDPSYLNVRVFFNFIKFKHFNMIYTIQRNISDLNKLCKLLLDNLTSENYYFLQLLIIHQIQLKLLNNYPIPEIKDDLDKLKKYQEDDNDFSLKTPIQFEAISILLEVLLSLYESEFNTTKEKIQKIDFFIKNYKTNNDKSWSNNLLFTFSLDKRKSYFSFELACLSFKEFSLISYLYCGILYTFKSWDNSNKSDKIFSLIHSALSSEALSLSTITSEGIQNRQLKNNYLKILISFYQLLSDFVKDKYPRIDSNNSNDSSNLLQNYKELYNFLQSYENLRLTSYETTIYNNLLPLVQYVFAMIYQRNGRLYESLYYYLQVRSLCSKSNTKVNSLSSNSSTSTRFSFEFFNDPINANFIQSNIGILGTYSQPLGLHNELYIISTLNALPIVQSIIELEKHNQAEVSEFDIIYDTYMKRLKNFLKLNETLVSQMNQIMVILENQQQNNKFRSFYNISIATLSYFYTQNDNILFLSNISMSEIVQTSPLLSSFLYLVMGYTYTTDPGLNELENLNKKVGFFTSACKYAIKACNDINKNSIAQLGYFEIWKIMNHNKNLYSLDDINHVYEKYDHFAERSKKKFRESVENNDTSVKRVKFV